MSTVTPERVEEVKSYLGELASYWRGDWSEFDGRILRDQLFDAIAALSSMEAPVPEAPKGWWET